jgi:serine/threonine protein kinase/formylglycine-generating enzyme required for sulfatase activity
MTPCPSQLQLEQFLDERLNGAERAAIETHVGQCAECQQALEQAVGQGDTEWLRGWNDAGPSPAQQPDTDVLRRLEQAALSASRTVLRADPPPADNGPPDRAAPAAAGDGDQLSDLPTRHADAGEAEAPVPLVGLHAGDMLGQYRILEQVGAGGMGQVYKAVHVTMDRIVALKVIAPHLVEDARARARFQQEVRTAARLHHPNIVMAHDAAEARGLSFLVMEHVEGTTLSALVVGQGLPPVPLACEIVRQAALGLQHAHEKHMVHRDIKPGNLMVVAQQTKGAGVSPPTRSGSVLPGWPAAPLVKILDFGVARLRPRGRDGEPLAQPSLGLTQEGCVVGTPEFMSPEQACDSRTVDIRSDIYSLGCTLYFLLSGRPPFSADTALETMVQHLRKPLPPVDQVRPGLPPQLANVVHRMLAKTAAERFQTPAEVAEALLPWTGELAPTVTVEGVAVPLAGQSAPPSGSAAGVATPFDKRNTDLMKAIQPGGAQASPPSPAGTRQRAGAPGGGTFSGAGTLLALFLLAFVSALAGYVILQMLDRSGGSGGDRGDEVRTNELGMSFASFTVGEYERAIGPKGQIIVFQRGLEVGTTEVTRGQFREFVREKDYKTEAEAAQGLSSGSLVPRADGNYWRQNDYVWYHCGADGEELPVTCVTWNDALEFCNWLSDKEGRTKCYEHPPGGEWIWVAGSNGYRLPTDAEWEYVARAGQEKLLPSTDLLDLGWFRENSTEDAPHPVGKKPANSRHLCDMWGNVREWCWDRDGPLTGDKKTDPVGPREGAERVVWGGAWSDHKADLARMPRRNFAPDHRSTDVGFRVVCTMP